MINHGLCIAQTCQPSCLALSRDLSLHVSKKRSSKPPSSQRGRSYHGTGAQKISTGCHADPHLKRTNILPAEGYPIVNKSHRSIFKAVGTIGRSYLLAYRSPFGISIHGFYNGSSHPRVTSTSVERNGNLLSKICRLYPPVNHSLSPVL